jgi:hypothetical protein
VPGNFYRKNLVYTSINPVEGKFFVINKILKERIAVDGKTEYFVNFLNYETKFNTWVREEDAVLSVPDGVK